MVIHFKKAGTTIMFFNSTCKIISNKPLASDLYLDIDLKLFFERSKIATYIKNFYKKNNLTHAMIFVS